MRNPQRNDVYVNSEGFKVVVNNVLSPNPAGVQTLEYKFIGSPELYFVPVQEFVEQFEFVETFASFDIYIEERNKLLQVKEEEEANKLIEDAKMLERIGCFALVLEKIPAHLAKKVAESISIPVIGIGAGNGVDGQVLVTHDMLGMTHEFSPRFLRRYLDLYSEMGEAFKSYIIDVKTRDFPNKDEQY